MQIEPRFLICENENRSYLIRDIPDNVPSVLYRTRPKGWIDSVDMLEWLQEPRLIEAHPHQRMRDLYIDNCSGQNLNEDILQAA